MKVLAIGLICIILLAQVATAQMSEIDLGVKIRCQSIKWVEVPEQGEATEYCQCCNGYKQLLHARTVVSWDEWIPG